MLELLRLGRDLVAGVLDAVWNLGLLVLDVGRDTLVHLHTGAPRLEGLLAGVVLAWVLLRRDRHPWLRVVSAPLKLVLDILDLAWDQGREVASDLWDVPAGLVRKGCGWCVAKVRAVYNWKMGVLRSLRDRLLNRGGDE
jgi:hypothetical protein